jgi:hypothetical protein
VTVDTSALVPLFDMGEKVGSLEAEVLDELYDFAHCSSLMPVGRVVQTDGFFGPMVLLKLTAK